MAHDPVRYPLSIERLVSAVEYQTGIIELGNGGESRTAWWDDALLSFNAVQGVRSLTDLRTLLSFFRARKGRARSFLIRDLSDYCLAANNTETGLMAIGTGDGTTTDFQVTKTYTDAAAGGNSDVRDIKKIEKQTVNPFKVYVNSVLKTEGTHWNFLNGYEGTPNIASKDGLIRFTGGNTPPNGHVIEVSGTFFVPARFLEDKLPADEIFYNMQPRDPNDPTGEWVVKDGAGPLPDVMMKEVRDA